jgi:hypothetical protein
MAIYQERHPSRRTYIVVVKLSVARAVPRKRLDELLCVARIHVTRQLIEASMCIGFS